MKLTALVVIVILLIAGWLVVSSAFYAVGDRQQVVVTQFGEPVAIVTSPGWHIKKPLIQKANYLDQGVQELETEPHSVLTLDKTVVRLTTRTSWRVSDAVVFFRRVRDSRRATLRLTDIIRSETRTATAKLTYSVVAEPRNFAYASEGRFHEVVLDAVRDRTQDLGFEVLDFKLQSIEVE